MADPRFVHLRLHSEFSVVDGIVRPLRPGMSGKAHVVTGSRTLAEHAADLSRRIREYLRGAESMGERK